MSELRNKIQALFDSKNTDRNVTRVCDFRNGEAYLCCAPRGEKDYNTPFFVVDLECTDFVPFSPAMDLDAFNDALDNVLDGG